MAIVDPDHHSRGVPRYDNGVESPMIPVLFWFSFSDSPLAALSQAWAGLSGLMTHDSPVPARSALPVHSAEGMHRTNR